MEEWSEKKRAAYLKRRDQSFLKPEITRKPIVRTGPLHRPVKMPADVQSHGGGGNATVDPQDMTIHAAPSSRTTPSFQPQGGYVNVFSRNPTLDSSVLPITDSQSKKMPRSNWHTPQETAPQESFFNSPHKGPPLETHLNALQGASRTPLPQNHSTTPQEREKAQQPAMPAELPFEMFRGWTVVATLGKGAYGVVYEIIKDGVRLAAKLIRNKKARKDPNNERFAQKVRFEAKLQHEFAVHDMAPHLRGWDIKDDQGVLVMDMISETLENRLRRLFQRPPSITQFKAVVDNIDTLIKKACANNLRQGDVHLGNVVILNNGHYGFIDFGRATSNAAKCQSSSSWIDLFRSVVAMTTFGNGSHPLVGLVQAKTAQAFRDDGYSVPSLLLHPTVKNIDALLGRYYYPFAGNSDRARMAMLARASDVTSLERAFLEPIRPLQGVIQQPEERKVASTF